jgi:RNA polymerase sigma factor (TIGR02999 family)
MTGEVTLLIHRMNDGDDGAEEQLIARLYDELRRLAARAMQRERGNHTLQATALANEALIRLLGDDVQYTDRLHFLRVCASTMRRVLVDYARARSAEKRGAGLGNVTLEASRIAGAGDAELALLSLNTALEKLEQLDRRKARIVELHFFSGLDVEEIAEVMHVSASTVVRDLRFSRAWLRSELAGA